MANLELTLFTSVAVGLIILVAYKRHIAKPSARTIRGLHPGPIANRDDADLAPTIAIAARRGFPLTLPAVDALGSRLGRDRLQSQGCECQRIAFDKSKTGRPAEAQAGRHERPSANSMIVMRTSSACHPAAAARSMRAAKSKCKTTDWNFDHEPSPTVPVPPPAHPCSAP